MARMGRWFVPGVPQHIIQRGNNRQTIFFGPDDFTAYKTWLTEIAAQNGLLIHAYVLMTNHVHLLATPATANSIPATMQTLGRLYVRYINHARGRSGSLWEGRYRATVVDDDAYLFKVMRYIEVNPVRAGMVSTPRSYAWSSYAANALGNDDALVTPHELYQALGRTKAARTEAYRALFSERLDKEALVNIRRSLNTGWALGAEKFQHMVARKTGRRASPLKRGPKPQPKKTPKPKRKAKPRQQRRT